MTIEEIKALYPVGTIFDSLGGNSNVIIKENDEFRIESKMIQLYTCNGHQKGRITNDIIGNDYNDVLAKIISKPLNEIKNNYTIY
jgi:hypothetical protein